MPCFLGKFFPKFPPQISDVYGELKERAQKVGLIINVDKTKAMEQNRSLWKGRKNDCRASQD